ncbi:MAG TPA: tRNA preQ1(34) S-adenosylmethionine ribosyltransferase-isomerase QueA [Candidatus Kryptonia bacterium]|nr:tRNA preQ1(34) S-adenosylmethionine ribosyltransferase-isomerase QueA [Candidatus Kryptonia bacterium]
MPSSDFSFDLPSELIAQEPVPARSAARLLVWERASGHRIHAHVSDLPSFLRAGDVIVFNDTKVIPARLYGRTESGAGVELLVIRRLQARRTSDEQELWQCLGRPRKRLRPGATLRFAGGVIATVASAHVNGRYEVAFETSDVPALLQAHGELPLPPYIKRPDGPLPFDRERYQTVFAAQPGAIAAPTAGLHFTPALLDALRAVGVTIAFLTLHVGPGTFLPVRTDDLNEHVMDPEWCEIPAVTATLVNRAHRDRRRVIAVGTTTTRALESASDESGHVAAGARWADRFIKPGVRFRIVDALFTNFHLPGSTLLALVAAFAGREPVLAVYEEAVARRYRFYSYGDAMFIQ